jgi:hypothetical protein
MPAAPSIAAVVTTSRMPPSGLPIWKFWRAPTLMVAEPFTSDEAPAFTRTVRFDPTLMVSLPPMVTICPFSTVAFSHAPILTVRSTPTVRVWLRFT